jgi:molybdopterin-guanine dinucleotide biosynthesis protein A
MGRNKALLPYRDGTLIQDIADTARLAAGSVTLVGRSGDYTHTGIAAIEDLWPGEGPLGGIVTALKHSQAQWTLILACDMPGLNAAFLGDLYAFATGSPAQAVVPVSSPERREPLCAWYNRRALEPLETLFLSGARSPSAALDALRVEYVLCDGWDVSNVNTPGEWNQYLTSHA